MSTARHMVRRPSTPKPATATPRNLEVLHAVAELAKAMGGKMPTLHEIAARMGFGHISARNHLIRLANAGFIQRSNGWRSIQILKTV